MNARAEQLRVTQMNRSSKNRCDSCATEEVCPIPGMSVEKTLATAGVVRDKRGNRKLDHYPGMSLRMLNFGS
jgi:hypothetical protein